jgi:Family of unknown function (DUF6182)
MLKTELDGRHQRARAGLHGTSREMADVAVPVVMREFDPQAVTDGAVKFAAALTPDQSDSWFRCYTRAVFLFGNPRNLAARHPVHQRAGDNAVGWLGVVGRKELNQLRRLLRPVTGALPAGGGLPRGGVAAGGGLPGGGVAAGGGVSGGTAWCLWLAIRDLDLAQYLVHLHHTVTEAVLTGKVRPGDTIGLRHVMDLHPSRLERSDCVYSRVHPSPGNPGRLRLYALLSHNIGLSHEG